MEDRVFDKLRKIGKENNIDIFKVKNYPGQKVIIHYYIDRDLNKNQKSQGDNDEMSYDLRAKIIEVEPWITIEEVITRIKLQNTKKPPFGITPRFIWIEQRVDEIIKAIDRYRESKQEIPKEWYFELAELETEKNKSLQNVTCLTMNAIKLSEHEIKELEKVFHNSINSKLESIL